MDFLTCKVEIEQQPSPCESGYPHFVMLTPNKEQACTLVRAYLPEEWGPVSNDDLEFEEMSHTGLTSRHFILKNKKAVKEPSEVAMTLYGRRFADRHAYLCVLPEDIIFNIYAQMWAKGWCPKQIGFFPGGRLDEFVHGHHMSGDTEGRQPDILADVGKFLARFHSLDYFFRKDQYDYFFDTPGYDTFKATHPFWQDENHRKAWKSGFEYNYKKEIEWIYWAFAQIGCPKSRWHMIHGDLNMGNWMVLDRPYRNYDLKVMLFDYELGCWGPRGHDLGGYFMKRMIRNGIKRYQIDEVFYPEEDEMSMVASAYIKEMQKLKPEWCDPERDSIPNVIREMELGIIAYSLACAFQVVIGAEKVHTFDDGSRGAYTGVLNLFLNIVPDEIIKSLKEKWCKKYGFPPEIPTKS